VSRTPINITGQRFGSLVAVSRADNNQRRQTRWLCLCDCGATTTVIGMSLRQGATRSCGCLRRKQSAANMAHARKHGTEAMRRQRKALAAGEPLVPAIEQKAKTWSGLRAASESLAAALGYR
jgi:GTP-sensing pleiotropic transcriptional regulator CodY